MKCREFGYETRKLAAFFVGLGKEAAELLWIFSSTRALLRERFSTFLLVFRNGFFQSFFCAFIHVLVIVDRGS
jgi:hypothetical protein